MAKSNLSPRRIAALVPAAIRRRGDRHLVRGGLARAAAAAAAAASSISTTGTPISAQPRWPTSSTRRGVPVHMSLFATNDELFARLRAGNPGFDVIVPSNEFVTRMSQAQMIQPLDHSQDSEHRQLAARISGRGVRSGPPLFDAIHVADCRASARTRPKLPAGFSAEFVELAVRLQIVFISASRCCRNSADLIRLGAKYLGHSVNNIPDAMLTQIEQMLIRQKPHVKAFHDDNGQDLLRSGEVDLVHGIQWRYRPVDGRAMAATSSISWCRRKAACSIPIRLCIPTGAPHLDDAHAFINYLLDARRRQGDHRNHPLPDAQPRGARSDAGELQEQSGHLPAGRRDGQVRVRRVRGRRASARQYEEIFTRISAA